MVSAIVILKRVIIKTKREIDKTDNTKQKETRKDNQFHKMNYNIYC